MTQLAIVALAIILLVYIGYCGFVYLTQRQSIYQPPADAPQVNSKEFKFKSGRANLSVSTEQVSGDKALVYFGGYDEDVSNNLSALAVVYPRRAQFLLQYRGYGNSSGRPSEKALLSDGLSLFDQVTDEYQDVIVIGRGLGAAVAVSVASQRPVASLILITPFDSLLHVLQSRSPLVPISLLLKDRFEAWRWAPKVKAPTLVIAAGKDEFVPKACTEALIKSFEPGVARLEVVSNAHHETISETDQFSDLLRTIRVQLTASA